MTEDFDKQLKKQSLNKGLVLGLIMGVLGILSFYFMTGMASSMLAIIAGPVVLSIIIPIVLAALFSGDLRKTIGGFWNFKQAVTGIFIMFFTAYVVSYLISSVLFAKLIEPNMVDKTEAAMVNVMTNMLEKTSADQAAIDKSLDDVHKKFEEQKNITVGKQIQSFAVGVIFVFVFALIFAAIYKKERPLYLNDAGNVEPTV
nr:DUF4199 domain-containing protein [uncultured Mucilaginibacter sp.]